MPAESELRAVHRLASALSPGGGRPRGARSPVHVLWYPGHVVQAPSSRSAPAVRPDSPRHGVGYALVARAAWSLLTARRAAGRAARRPVLFTAVRIRLIPSTRSLRPCLWQPHFQVRVLSGYSRLRCNGITYRRTLRPDEPAMAAIPRSLHPAHLPYIGLQSSATVGTPYPAHPVDVALTSLSTTVVDDHDLRLRFFQAIKFKLGGRCDPVTAGPRSSPPLRPTPARHGGPALEGDAT